MASDTETRSVERCEELICACAAGPIFILNSDWFGEDGQLDQAPARRSLRLRTAIHDLAQQLYRGLVGARLTD